MHWFCGSAHANLSASTRANNSSIDDRRVTTTEGGPTGQSPTVMSCERDMGRDTREVRLQQGRQATTRAIRQPSQAVQSGRQTKANVGVVSPFVLRSRQRCTKGGYLCKSQTASLESTNSQCVWQCITHSFRLCRVTPILHTVMSRRPWPVLTTQSGQDCQSFMVNYLRTPTALCLFSEI